MFGRRSWAKRISECRCIGVERERSDRVSRYFARVTGRPRRQVRRGEFLTPGRLRPPAVEEAEPAVLSAGAQEWLFVLTRLALALALTSAEGRQLSVLDDTLVNNDPVRHQRVVELRVVELREEATEQLQVVFFTCKGEWYRTLWDVSMPWPSHELARATSEERRG